jgi:biotin carboxylase
MDPITLIVLGLTAVQGIAGVMSANKQAKAMAQEASLNASNKAKETRIKAARAQASFLSSGLSLQGTPETSIENIFLTGKQDIYRIRSNAKSEISSTIGAARNEALFSMAMAGAGAAQGSGMFSNGGFVVPGTGKAASTSAGGAIIPGQKPTFINFGSFGSA